MSVKILGTGRFHPGQGFAAGTFRLKIQHQRWQ